jgi:hypothetical protein
MVKTAINCSFVSMNHGDTTYIGNTNEWFVWLVRGGP